MKLTLWSITIALLLQGTAFAQDLVVCDPTHPQVPNAVTRYEESGDFNAFLGRSGFLVWDAPNTLHTPKQVAAFNALRAQLDSLAGVPQRYWKCVDTTVPVDGLVDAVTEMSQPEKDARDAPDVAQQALSTEYETLTSQLDADDANWASLTTAQKLAVAKKLLRREVLKQRLGQ